MKSMKIMHVIWQGASQVRHVSEWAHPPTHPHLAHPHRIYTPGHTLHTGLQEVGRNKTGPSTSWGVPSYWPTLKSLSHNIIHLFVLKLQSNRHSRIFPKCYVGGRVFSKAYKIVRRTTTCSHGSLHSQLNRTGLHFTAKGDGAAAQRSVPSMHRQRRARRPRKKSTTARQFHEHDGSSICHHKGLRTATAKSYSPHFRQHWTAMSSGTDQGRYAC